jgi:transposase InsO family protein
MLSASGCSTSNSPALDSQANRARSFASHGLPHSPSQLRDHRTLTPDLVNRDFTAQAPDQKMVGDITYIPTWQGWVYLATVIDCYTKACIGYAMADHLRAELVIDALAMAARNSMPLT